MRPAPGNLGPYALLDMLGQGAMGTVYRARHVELGAVRAVKVLLGNQTPPRVERFLRETRHLAKVRHPNVVGVHDAGQAAEGHLYYAMDLVEGEALDRVLARGRLDYDRALEVAIAICRGVHALHQAGILHRDLKPANIVLRPGGEPVVLDLGLAVAPELDQRITKTGALLGTPHYMAPEQIRGEKATASSDVYALGLITHELLSGYSVSDSGELPGFAKVPAPSSVDGGLPRAFDRICGRALARDRSVRFASVAELIAALEELREAPGITRRMLRRVQLGAVCALALAGLGAVIAATPPAPPAPPGDGGQASAKPDVQSTPDAAPALSAQDVREATRELRKLVRLDLVRRREALGAWIERNPKHPNLEAARLYRRDARLRTPLRVQPLDRDVGFLAVGFLESGTAVFTGPTKPPTRWRLKTGETLETWDLVFLRALEASPKGESFVAVCVNRGLLRVFVDPPKEVLLTPEDRIWTLAFSPDGRSLAYAARGSLFVVDLALGAPPELVGKLIGAAPSRRGSATAMAFSPDGRYLVVGAEKEVGVHLWDLRTRTLVYQAPQLSKVHAVAFAPDGRTYVIGRGGGTLGVMTVEGPRQTGLYGSATGTQNASKGIRGVCFSPDGKTLHSLEKTDRTDENAPGRRAIWDTTTRERLATIAHQSAEGAEMRLSSDGTLLLVGVRTRVELWEVGVPPKLPAIEDATE